MHFRYKQTAVNQLCSSENCVSGEVPIGRKFYHLFKYFNVPHDETEIFVFCMLKYWLNHTRKVLYVTMLYGKEHFKFRVSLRVDPIIKEVKWVKATVFQGVEAVYSLNTISDEQRPFCGGSSRMEIMNITSACFWNLQLQHNSYRNTGNTVTKRQTGQQ